MKTCTHCQPTAGRKAGGLIASVIVYLVVCTGLFLMNIAHGKMPAWYFIMAGIWGLVLVLKAAKYRLAAR